MENLPLYVYATFGITVALGLWLFSRATQYSKPFLVIAVLWGLLQSILGVTGFYSDPLTMTLRFPLLFGPALLFTLVRFITPSGRAFLDSLDIRMLTLVHVVRIPVEVVLLWLYLHHAIPVAMTFEGRNFDILSGITAPLVYYFGFIKGKLSYNILLAWNFLGLALLINVVANAILSLPTRWQHFGFEQPNLALGYFPFVLIPALLVPLVFLSQVAAIRQLLAKKETVFL